MICTRCDRNAGENMVCEVCMMHDARGPREHGRALKMSEWRGTFVGANRVANTRKGSYR